jgi:hypothetical protein
MKYILAIIVACLVCLTLAMTGVAQDKQPPIDIWGLRSESITTSLIGDATSLESFERAIMFARLGDAWWDYDRERARSWIKKSIEIVEYMPDEHDATEHLQRLATAREILKIGGPRDEDLGRTLKDILTSDAGNGSTTENNLSADALIETALAIVKSDPQRAEELGVESLRIGHPTMLAGLLWELRRRDTKLADHLFMQGVIAVRETYDYALFSSLLRVAFPVLDGAGPAAPAPPDLLRSQLAQAVVLYLQQVRGSTNEPAALCSQTASFLIVIVPLRNEFDRFLPPAQSAFMRQSITACQSSLGSIGEQRVEESQREPLKTVEDFLASADRAKSPNAKTVLQVGAAQLAVHQRNIDRALSILDAMDTEARIFLNGAWEKWRSEWAALSALEHLKNDDFAGMRRIIEAVPAGLRVASQISLAYQAPPQKYGDLIIGLLQEAREGLPKADMTNAEKGQWYLPLLKLYAKFLPVDAFAVFKEMIAALNRTERATPTTDKNLSEPGKSELANTQSTYDLPLSLLETDQFAFLGAITSIESPTRRAKIRLELLSSSLSQRKRSNSRPKPSKS